MSSQINIKKSNSFAIPPSGSLGYSFDSLGNPCVINSDGSKTIIPISGDNGVVINIIANLGVGLEADLPTSSLSQGDIYVTNDTYKIYTRVDDVSWSVSDIEKSQFVTDTFVTSPILYQYAKSLLNKLAGGSIPDQNYIDFVPQETPPSYKLGRIFYDSTENTHTAYNDIEGISLQIGEELRGRLINDLGFTALNGKAVSIIGSVGTSLQIELLDCSNLNSSIRAFGLLTHEILDGQPGYAVRFGAVRELNTSLFAVGDIIYGDPLNPGDWTNVRPLAPYYPVRIGICLISNPILGVIGVDTLAFNGSDTTVNIEGLPNGTVLNTQDVVFSVDAGVIYADVTNETYPARNLPFMLGGVRYDLDTLTNTGSGGAARVIVPPGASDILKQTSLIYIYLNAGVPTLAVTTSTPSVPYCSVCYVVAYNAPRTVTDGRVFAYRRYNNVADRLDGVHDGSFGLLTEILTAIRLKLGSNWIIGQDATTTVNDTTIRIALTAGIGSQFRVSNLPAFDGLNYLIYNTTANVITYASTTNLTSITTTAAGVSLLSNNRFYTIRIFYQLNSNGIGNSVIATRPLGFYTTPAEAISDPLRYAVGVNDTDIEEFVYPLYDLVIGRTGTGGTTISLIQLTPRKSKLASGEGGGGAAGAAGTDDKVRISAADTTNDYLNAKAIGTTGQIVATLLNAGANEQLAFSLADIITKNILFSAQVRGGYYVQAFSATPTFNFNNGNNQQITLTGNITSWAISNALPSGSYSIWFIQNSTGGWTISEPTGITYKTDNSGVFITAANSITVVNIVVMPNGSTVWSIVDSITV